MISVYIYIVYFDKFIVFIDKLGNCKFIQFKCIIIQFFDKTVKLTNYILIIQQCKFKTLNKTSILKQFSHNYFRTPKDKQTLFLITKDKSLSEDSTSLDVMSKTTNSKCQFSNNNKTTESQN